MAIEVLMPKLGMIMTEGQVTRWLKQPGEAVQRGEPILEVTTEKINYEVEAGGEGTLHPVVPEGETVPVGAVVGFLLAPGEAPPAEIPPPRPVEVSGPEAEAAAAAPSAPAPTAGPAAAGGEVRASPAARRLARDLGVALERVTGTGPGGRIVEADVQAAAGAAPVAQPAAPARPTREVRPLAGMRRTIAERMRRSLQDAAQLTLHTEADVTDFVARRQSYLRDGEQKRDRITYADLIIKAAAEALRRHPKINAAIVGNEIHYLEEINIGFAVALDDGLIVPVVHRADQKSIDEIARETADLAGRARDGRLKPDEVSGGTFTVSVLGVIDAFTPILNPPESAILGVGRIVEKPGVHEGAIAVRSMMALSLTIDHRVIDGEPGALFLRRVRQYLEAPDRLF